MSRPKKHILRVLEAARATRALYRRDHQGYYYKLFPAGGALVVRNDGEEGDALRTIQASGPGHDRAWRNRAVGALVTSRKQFEAQLQLALTLPKTTGATHPTGASRSLYRVEPGIGDIYRILPEGTMIRLDVLGPLHHSQASMWTWGPGRAVHRPVGVSDTSGTRQATASEYEAVLRQTMAMIRRPHISPVKLPAPPQLPTHGPTSAAHHHPVAA